MKTPLNVTNKVIFSIPLQVAGLVLLLFASYFYQSNIVESPVPDYPHVRSLFDFYTLYGLHDNFSEEGKSLLFDKGYLISWGIIISILILGAINLIQYSWSNARAKQSFEEKSWVENKIPKTVGGISFFLLLVTLILLVLSKYEWARSFMNYTGITIVFLLVFFIYSILISFGPTVKWFFKKFNRYFYITILYIFLLAAVFTGVEQADAFFIELFDNGSEKDLMIFAAYLVPTSLIVVWYLPYYLYFSNTFYSGITSGVATNNKAEKKELQNAFFTVPRRFYFNLILPVRTIYDNNEVVRNYLANYNSAKNRAPEDIEEDKYFHIARRILGISYVLSFIFLFSKLLTKAGMTEWYISNAMIISLVLIGTFYLLSVIQMKRIKYNSEKFAYDFYEKNLKDSDTNDSDDPKSENRFVKFLSRDPFFTIWLPLSFFLFFYLTSFSGIYEDSINLYNVILSFFGGAFLYLFQQNLTKQFSDPKDNEEGEGKITWKGVYKTLKTILFFAVIILLVILVLSLVNETLKSFLLLVLSAGGSFAFYHFNRIKNSKTKIEVIGEKQKTPVKRMAHALVTLVAFVVTTFLLIKILFFSGDKGLWEQSSQFLVYQYFFLWSFMGFAFYRRFARMYKFEGHQILTHMFRVVDEIFTPLMMMLIFLMFAIFCSSFVASLFHFETIVDAEIHTLKTINIFFVFANGLFAGIALLHRTLILRNQEIIFWADKKEEGVGAATAKSERNKYDEYKTLIINTPVKIRKDSDHVDSEKINKLRIKFFKRTNIRFFMFAFFYSMLIVGLWFYFQGTDHHTLEFKAEKDENSIGLEEYTQRFLKRMDKSKPIVLIASDGGGVKAAYWTMRVLEQLEQISPGKFYKNNVFLTSGASGGSIGLGMFNYFNAQGLSSTEIYNRIDTIGKTNFLNADLTGFMTRWPILFLPKKLGQIEWRDRMDLMSRRYFNQTEDTSKIQFSYDVVSQNPYSYLWSKNNYALPLFVTNTAQMEHGKKGIFHPLNSKLDKELFNGSIDLSFNQDGKYSNFPDALFTTNRFPIMSPKAKIEGKGHFFDVGVIENSGIGTILQFLDYMKIDTNYQEFFEQEILLISIRCAKSRYIYDNFNQYKNDLDETPEMLTSSAIISVVSNDGMTGFPRYFDDVLKDSTYRFNKYGIKNFETINIPFRISGSEKDVEDVLGGSIHNYKLRKSIIEEVEEMDKSILENFNNGKDYFLEPPLGRLISKPSRKYMDTMSILKSKKIIEKYGN